MNTKVASVDSKDMAAIKTARGVPEELWSCHTMEVDGYIIEGHVPAEAVAKLLRERPAGVAGLAVPGMPLGSPGMEAGDRVQPRSEEHTSELQSLMRISYAVFCLKKKKQT